jgi:hypothetical protein
LKLPIRVATLDALNGADAQAAQVGELLPRPAFLNPELLSVIGQPSIDAN